MPLAAADITPTLESVASNIRTLTRNRGGGEEGTFNNNTRPSADEATVVTARASRYVAQQIGQPDFDLDDPANAPFLDSAKDAVALYAALQIATSFFDDGSDSISSLVDQLGRLAREQIKSVVETARSNQTGGQRIHSIPTVDAGRYGDPLAGLQPPGLDDPDLLLLQQQIGNGTWTIEGD